MESSTLDTLFETPRLCVRGFLYLDLICQHLFERIFGEIDRSPESSGFVYGLVELKLGD